MFWGNNIADLIGGLFVKVILGAFVAGGLVGAAVIAVFWTVQ